MMRAVLKAAGIQFVGAAYSDGASSTTSRSVSLTSLTGGVDTAPIAGDFVLVIATASDSADLNLGTTGYTEVADLYADNTGSTADCSLSVSYKSQSGTPDTSVTVTSAIAAFYNVEVYVLRGVNSTTPLDVSVTTATTTTNSALPNPPSITPVTAGAAVLAISGVAGGGSLSALANSGLTDLVTGGGGFAQIGVGVALYGWTGGAVDPAAFTSGGTGIRASASVTMALRPA